MENAIYEIKLTWQTSTVSKHKIMLCYSDDTSIEAIKTFFKELASRYYPKVEMQEVIIYSDDVMYIDTDYIGYRIVITKVEKLEGIFSLS